MRNEGHEGPPVPAHSASPHSRIGPPAPLRQIPDFRPPNHDPPWSPLHTSGIAPSTRLWRPCHSGGTKLGNLAFELGAAMVSDPLTDSWYVGTPMPRTPC